MEKIINMTPHPINIVDGDGKLLRTIETSGDLIRLKSETVRRGELDGIATSETVFGNPEGLPPFNDGVFYVVSQLVKASCKGRNDLLVPAEVMRDDKGRIIGCQSLGC